MDSAKKECHKPDLKRTLQKNGIMLYSPYMLLSMTCSYLQYLLLISRSSACSIRRPLTLPWPVSHSPAQAGPCGQSRQCQPSSRWTAAVVQWSVDKLPSSAACIAALPHVTQAAHSLSLPLSHAWGGGLLMAPRWLGGNIEQALLPSKHCNRFLRYHQSTARGSKAPQSFLLRHNEQKSRPCQDYFITFIHRKTRKRQRIEVKVETMCLTSFSHV